MRSVVESPSHYVEVNHQAWPKCSLYKPDQQPSAIMLLKGELLFKTI